ncbi:MAG: hypothetical protein OEX02_07990, partial [Cyclobacteriaceae bacterium]|nr:hypothetical protein [Cyclobacteriaceae bacterium]
MHRLSGQKATTQALRAVYIQLITLLMALLPQFGHGAEGPLRTYSAPLSEGVIGVRGETGYDNPSDNIFHVGIGESLCGDEPVWLTYELSGVSSHLMVPVGINDELSLGGYVVGGTSHGWQLQRQRVDARWLKTGDNVFRFTLPEGAGHSYKVRNVSIEVGVSSGSLRGLRYEHLEGGGRTYVQGLVEGEGRGEANVFVGGKLARVQNGAFEAVVSSEEAAEGLDLEVVYANGESYCEFFSSPSGDTGKSNFFNLEKGIERAMSIKEGGSSSRLVLGSAGLEVPSGAMEGLSLLSVTALRERDLAPLDAGMVNVTSSHSGYRFLPHGTQFLEPSAITMGYDMEKLPSGYTVQDIRTYYFDELSHHWVALPRDTALVDQEYVVSRTLHFTDMINAIIKVPESPDASAYTPTSMKGIKAANPAAGLNLMSPPSANNTGAAGTGYGLNIPAGRGGMQPQLGLNYNSGGGNGWLGTGWSLSTPSVGIDTRWGAPRYDNIDETETYSMNGQMLTPVAHRGKLREREGGTVRFYPRVEGGFQKIERHGNGTQDYFWTVTDKSGTKYFYGSSNGKVLDPTKVLMTDGGHVAHWALGRVEDLQGNYISYEYETVEDSGNPGN